MNSVASLSDSLLVLQLPATSASELSLAVVDDGSVLTFTVVDATGVRHVVDEFGDAVTRPVFIDLLRVKNAEAGCWSEPSDSRVTLGRNLPLWHLPDVDTLYLYSKSKEPWSQVSLDLLDPGTGKQVQVEPRREYVFRLLAAVHRCDARVVISVLDDRGALLSTDEVHVDPRHRGGEARGLYHAIECRIVVPERGHALSIQFLRGVTSSKRDSYLFLADPRLHAIREHGTFDVITVTESLLRELRALHGAALPALRRARIPLPAAIAGLESREVQVLVQSATRHFVSPKIAIPAVTLPGKLRGILNGIAFGWLELPPNASTDDLAATCDSVRCAISFAAPDTGAQDFVRVPFRFALPPSAASAESIRLVIHRDGSLESMAGSPFVISAATTWGEFDGISGIACTGWATAFSMRRPRLELCIDGVVATTFVPDAAYPDFVTDKLSRASVAFRVLLPESALDGNEHGVAIRFAETGVLLEPGEKSFRFAPKGTIDRISPRSVEGWLFNPGSKEGPLDLELRINGESVAATTTALQRTDVAREHGRRSVGFHFALRETFAKSEVPLAIELVIAGTERRVLGPVHATFPTFRAIEALERWSAEALRKETPVGDALSADAAALELLRQRIIPSVLESWRLAMKAGATSLDIVREPRHARPDEARPVDIIIPVYKGFLETLDCIESVLAARVDVPHRILVVNDASPDAALAEALRAKAGTSRIVLLENGDNLGFVATVNRGMRASEDRDVVLLNSDAVVADGWLDALTNAAYSSDDVGTVTPLSNRATICSIPQMNVDNDMPVGFDVAAMNRLCQEHGEGGLVDIPTAVGFCMYIRRRTLVDTGLFNEQRWKKGYGEENDFCVSARARGWRSVATTDCFVQHHGSVSFAGEKAARVRENGEVLLGLYPDYDARVHAFIAADPIRPFRNRINAQLIGASDARHVVHVVHSLGGGTHTAVDQMADDLEQNGFQSLIASPSQESCIQIRNRAGTVTLRYDLETEGDALREALHAMGVVLLHVHHVAGFSPSVLHALRETGVPYLVTTHDYFFACPRVDLRDSTGTFCNLAASSTCDGCVNATPVPEHSRRMLVALGGSVTAWRTTFGLFFAEARAVFAPSEDTRTRLERAFPGVRITARAHPDRRPLVPLRAESIRPFAIAVLGAIGDHKGYAMLLALARYADAIASPIRFTIVGYTRNDGAFATLPHVTITGRYEPEELTEIVRDSGASIALFLSTWSETYSYTLSEAFQFGLYPVALDLGAFRERIEAACCGELLPPDITVADLHTRLMNILEFRQQPGGTAPGPNDPWRNSPTFYYRGIIEA